MHSEYASVETLFEVIYLNETNKLEQKHICKIESLVVLQSIVNGLTRVQTVNSTFCTVFRGTKSKKKNGKSKLS